MCFIILNCRLWGYVVFISFLYNICSWQDERSGGGGDGGVVWTVCVAGSY